ASAANTRSVASTAAAASGIEIERPVVGKLHRRTPVARFDQSAHGLPDRHDGRCIVGQLWSVGARPAEDLDKCRSGLVVPALTANFCLKVKCRRRRSQPGIAQSGPMLAQQLDEPVAGAGFDAIGADVRVVVPGHGAYLLWRSMISAFAKCRQHLSAFC